MPIYDTLRTLSPSLQKRSHQKKTTEKGSVKDISTCTTEGPSTNNSSTSDFSQQQLRLTDRQTTCIRRSWDSIPDKQRFAELVFAQIFLAQPGLKQLFNLESLNLDRKAHARSVPGIRPLRRASRKGGGHRAVPQHPTNDQDNTSQPDLLTDEEIALTHDRFRAHCARFVKFWNKIVENICSSQDPGAKDIVTPMIRGIGALHSTMRHVTFDASNWLSFKNAMLEHICGLSSSMGSKEGTATGGASSRKPSTTTGPLLHGFIRKISAPLMHRTSINPVTPAEVATLATAAGHYKGGSNRTQQTYEAWAILLSYVMSQARSAFNTAVLTRRGSDPRNNQKTDALLREPNDTSSEVQEQKQNISDELLIPALSVPYTDPPARDRRKSAPIAVGESKLTTAEPDTRPQDQRPSTTKRVLSGTQSDSSNTNTSNVNGSKRAGGQPQRCKPSKATSLERFEDCFNFRPYLITVGGPPGTDALPRRTIVIYGHTVTDL